MNKQKAKQLKRIRRRAKIRAKISGTKQRPRLSVFKSNKAIYLQLIDDKTGKTLISASTKEVKTKDKKQAVGFELGKILAQKALAKQIAKAAFDRGGYKFHGRVKAVADGAKEGGLKI